MANCPNCGTEINPYDGFICLRCGQTIDRFTIREDGLVRLKNGQDQSSPLFRIVDKDKIALWDKRQRREVILSTIELELLLQRKT